MDRLTLDQEGFAQQLIRDTSISPEDLDSAFISQASLFAFYAEQSRIANKKVDNFKMRIDMVEAELDKEIRDEAALTSSKITEKSIEQEIKRSERYQKAVMSYNDAKAMAQLLRDSLDALKQRKDMLIQLGNNQREEFRSKLLMNEKPTQDEMKERRKSFVSEKEAA